MAAHFIAVAQSLLIFLVMAVSFYGWGRLGAIFLRIRSSAKVSVISTIWLGWAFALLIFQIAHLFFPLTAYVVTPLFLTGILLTIPHIPTIARSFFQNNGSIFITLSLMTLLVLAAWVASRGMVTVRNYDAGLYYYNLVRWINSYPIVPGLGVLHGRLAYNQSFFTYMAALNFYPFFMHGQVFANSFLFLLTLATLVKLIRPAIDRPSLLVESHPFVYLPAIFALPILGYLVFTEFGPVDPTPDVTSTLLQITMFVMLLHRLALRKEENNRMKGEIAVLAILAATSITVKMSNLAFAAVVLIFCLAFLWYSSKRSVRSLSVVLLPVIFIFLVWSFQGYILSGAPFFPLTIGYIPFKWAVPYSRIVDEASWIYSWARQPNAHWNEVLGSWNWFRPWLSRIRNANFSEVVYPVMCAFVFAGSAMLVAWIAFKKKYRLLYREWVILIPPLAGLFYWFFTAPNPRFAGALFWLLSLSSALLLALYLQALLKKPVFATALLIILIVAHLNTVQFAYTHVSRLKNISRAGWQANITVPVVENQTSSGLVIYSPESGDQCWDSPLPCTPYFRSRIRLIVPDDLGSGFYLD
jgi:hypothetical protein